MARVKGGTVTHARRKRVLKRASGYFGSKHLLFKTAKEQVMHSLRYAYVSRRNIKRDYRKLWIRRINAACRMYDISYSKFMNGLTKAGIISKTGEGLNRKMLSELAIADTKAFAELVKAAKKALENGKNVIIEKPMPTHKEAVQLVFDALLNSNYGVIESMDEVYAIGHRAVHGGNVFTDSVLVGEKEKELLKEEMSQISHKTWIDPLKIASIVDNKIVLEIILNDNHKG